MSVAPLSSCVPRSQRIAPPLWQHDVLTPTRPPQIFVIKIRLGAFAWTVYRRFTQFRLLGEQVRGSRMRWLAAALRALSYTRPLAAAA